MKITFLGTGTSMPDPNRVQSGILVEHDDYMALFDVGSGVLHRLVQTVDDITRLDSVFISHFHIDHCSDFLPLCQSLWLSKYMKTLKVYGPPSLKEWSRGIFDVAFPYLREKIIIDMQYLGENDAIQSGPLAISVCPTHHGSTDTRAFRIECEGKSLLISGDTAPCRDIIELGKGVDLLIHECNWLDGSLPTGVHTTPSDLTSIVEEIAPKKVIIVHTSPEIIKNKDKVLNIIGRRTDAEVILGEDLMNIQL
ncbi:MAG: MBL fold metallo-hydrolase [Candidatus Thorarchaeota archaeon]